MTAADVGAVADKVAGYVQAGAAVWLAIKLDRVVRALSKRVERVEVHVGLEPPTRAGVGFLPH